MDYSLIRMPPDILSPYEIYEANERWTHCPNCKAPRKNEKFIHEKDCIYYSDKDAASILCTLIAISKAYEQ